MRNIIVDTGAIVAWFNVRDPHHARAAAFFAALRPNDRLVTTWPVITEACFLLERNREAFFDWLALAGMEVISITLEDLAAMRKWMAGYRDREIDLADASLAWLAAREHTQLVATIDFNDFEAYRTASGKRFRNLIAAP